MKASTQSRMTFFCFCFCLRVQRRARHVSTASVTETIFVKKVSKGFVLDAP